jgi:hypothetical protein
MASKQRNKGFKKIVGNPGALHRQLGVPVGQKIPPGKKAAALSGKFGPVAKQRAARAFRGVLSAGRATAAKNANTPSTGASTRKQSREAVSPSGGSKRKPAFPGAATPFKSVKNTTNSADLFNMGEAEINAKREARIKALKRTRAGTHKKAGG